MNQKQLENWKFAALLSACSALCACHGERPDVVAEPADSGAPGLLTAPAPPAVPTDASAPSDAAATDAPAADNGAALLTEPPIAERTPAASVAKGALSVAVSANNAFALALYAQIRRAAAAANLLTSPISAQLALSMASAGATGQTRTEMTSALRFGTNSAQTVFDGQNALSQALLSRAAPALAEAKNRGSGTPPVAADYQLNIVNSLWGEATYTWESPFLKTLAADYGASVYKQDFRGASDPARKRINAWVSQQTNDKINELLPPNAVTGDTRLVLVNALHLKFPWDRPFPKGNTTPAPFTRVDKTQISTPFMHLSERMPYIDDGSAQIAALPLAGRQLAVVIALPHPGITLESYERSLRAGAAGLAQPTHESLVALALPKAAFTSPSFSLTAALRALGMKQAFDAHDAHFEGMCAHPPDNHPLFIGDVVQKTMIEMQESGVEAAAATAVVMMTAAAVHLQPPPVPTPMIVNRPYLVAVVDVPTGAVLMLGHITDPSAAPQN